MTEIVAYPVDYKDNCPVCNRVTKFRMTRTYVYCKVCKTRVSV